ncbi:valine--tRNA ligase [Mycoplasma phocoenae]|uniref:Valine--tRNA ligase n=1 Tax=Mycoplasma phocoenae TaxID=754517 RepID=A0A858U1J7_9MOLU|nr:valine--tRNA ligase [Mycoplasma phocoenae]QJG66994.1 valine--tRNA ligase [Mycoplasma phocoenae]
MEKNFNHKIIEEGRYDKWVNSKVFEQHDKTKRPFTIILPPPNVTGILHIGHALDTYLQDTMIRYKKIRGFDTLFLPGKDHAGIATQSKVEKLLQEQGVSKHEIGRDKFIEKVWEWKNKYGSIIDSQWKSLGLALDYSHERFTLDQNANEAVLKVFVDLYNKGIIYRGTRAISWDPVLETALSNIEVISNPIEQEMYYIKYPIKGTEEFLEVATTRIETIPSDVAIAFHPSDERYKKYLSSVVVHPFTNKEIPIITDDYIDPEFGSGLMKVSAHATNDIDIITKNNLEINECIDSKGNMNSLANEFEGINRFEARKLIAQKMQESGYLLKVEKTISNVGISERSGEVIEILVQPQWFMKMDKMSKMILDNLNTEEKVKFFPTRFEDVIKTWMENVYDWTISRQLWWGHRIPAYYKGEEVKVQLTSPGDEWIQDEDVLDTWFSSGLAPFVFLGWPQSNAEVEHYYPTSLLVTGYDIIFFWVARMYFMGLEFQHKIPFKDVLIHGLVRDENGRKMSKSLGNGIDPMKVIDEYGSDVLRIALLFNSTPGQDINFSTQKLEAAKLFINKFWNIARYVNSLETIENDTQSFDNYDLWILEKLNEFETQLDINMNKYEFTVVYKIIQKFIANEFSGWYLEFAKFKKNNALIKNIFKKILFLMHAFLPFTTDYLFELMYNKNLLEQQEFIIEQPISLENKTDTVVELISELRKYRESKNISKSKELLFQTSLTNLSEQDYLIISKLTNCTMKENNDNLIQCSNFTINIVMDQETKDLEIERLTKLLEDIQIDIDFVSKMLNNPKFVEKANPEKVTQTKEKLNLFNTQKATYIEELNKLK